MGQARAGLDGRARPRCDALNYPNRFRVNAARPTVFASIYPWLIAAAAISADTVTSAVMAAAGRELSAKAARTPAFGTKRQHWLNFVRHSGENDAEEESGQCGK
jgi:hypothetical protein